MEFFETLCAQIRDGLPDIISGQILALIESLLSGAFGGLAG